MEISAAISDATAAAAAQGLGFSSKLLLLARHSRAQGPTLSLSSAAAPPVAVRSNPFRIAVAPRAFASRTRRRTRRRSRTDGDAGEDGDDDGDDGFPGDGSGDDGPFGGGGGGGWNYGDSGSHWDGGSEQPSDDSSSDPAFGFVYEVLCWIAFSNCTHFALKRIGVLVAEKGKTLPLRFLPLTC